MILKKCEIIIDNHALSLDLEIEYSVYQGKAGGYLDPPSEPETEIMGFKVVNHSRKLSPRIKKAIDKYIDDNWIDIDEKILDHYEDSLVDLEASYQEDDQDYQKDTELDADLRVEIESEIYH